MITIVMDLIVTPNLAIILRNKMMTYPPSGSGGYFFMNNYCTVNAARLSASQRRQDGVQSVRESNVNALSCPSHWELCLMKTFL